MCTNPPQGGIEPGHVGPSVYKTDALPLSYRGHACFFAFERIPLRLASLLMFTVAMPDWPVRYRSQVAIPCLLFRDQRISLRLASLPPFTVAMAPFGRTDPAQIGRFTTVHSCNAMPPSSRLNGFRPDWQVYYRSQLQWRLKQ